MRRPILRLNIAPRPIEPPKPRDDLRTIAARWPKAFTQPPRPLARGIRDGIATALNWPEDRVGRALLRWVDRPAYLSACRPGAPRIGLDGRPDGTVTEPEAAWATQRLAAKQTELKDRRNAA